MKKGIIVLFLMLMLPFASAEIFISNPKSVYNIGDEFKINVSILSNVDMSDFFVTKLICVENDIAGEVEIYRVPATIKGGVQRILDVSGVFGNFLIGSLNGRCFLKANYGTYESTSQEFTITREIYVNLATGKVILNPGDRFNITGAAIKGNGEYAAGFVELKINEIDLTSFKNLEDGKFMSVFAIPDNAPAGSYDIHARAYEKNEKGEITNEGEGKTTIRVNQVVRKGEIALNSQSVKPNEDFIFSIVLYDQSGKEATDNVKTEIFDLNGALYSENLIKSGDAYNLTITKDFNPGTWKIKFKLNDNVQGEKNFYIEEFANASFNLVNGTLYVTNTGNVPYKKSVEITIGEKSEIEDISLDVGESTKFRLSAPNGVYGIKVSDGEKQSSLGTSFLTGSAIRVDGEGGGFWKNSYLIIWLMLISLAMLFAFYQYDRVSKKSYYGKTPSYSAPIKLNPSSTEKDIISEGKREECAVISLKIKNLEEVEKSKGSAMDALERALIRAKDAKAKIYSDRNYKTIVFSPSMTKEEDNNLKAVRIAKEIENVLTEHNKRFGERIMFGIGVHGGEMIVESRNGEFKFNSIGNTIPSAKKIAEHASYGVGLSEHMHRRVLGKVKTDRDAGGEFWRLRKVMEREGNSEFINKFKDRNKFK